MKRKPTSLEIAMLDELRHVFLALRQRWITPKSYGLLLGELRAIITQAEKEIVDEH